MRRMLAALFLLPALAGADAYRCVGEDGSVTFTDIPCSAAATPLQLRKGPPAPPIPAPESEAPAAEPEPGSASTQAPAAPPSPSTGPTSYRCTTPDGMVFYRHHHCPAHITVTHYGNFGGFATSTPGYAPVDESPVSPRAACDAIYDPDAGHRFGSGYDERYSTYDRNAGRDPCRR